MLKNDFKPRGAAMLKLESASIEPFWLDVLPGVRIRFRPVSVASMLIARAAAGEALKSAGDGAVIEAGAAFTRALAQQGIVAWEGIGDASGKPVDPGKETIDQLLELWPAFDAIDRLYVGPALMAVSEKNV
jgi:hypothetical protein